MHDGTLQEWRTEAMTEDSPPGTAGPGTAELQLGSPGDERNLPGQYFCGYLPHGDVAGLIPIDATDHNLIIRSSALEYCEIATSGVIRDCPLTMCIV